MKKSILLFFIIYIWFIGCDKPIPKPDNLIDRDDFINTLTETYLYKNIGPGEIKSGKYDISQEEAYILKSKNTDWQAFKDSYAYYMSDEKSASKINEAVVENLEMMIPKNDEEEIDRKIKEIPKKIKKDSGVNLRTRPILEVDPKQKPK